MRGVRVTQPTPRVASELLYDAVARQVWRQHRFRLHFAARDDVFDRGFFAAMLASGTPASRSFASTRSRAGPRRSSCSRGRTAANVLRGEFADLLRRRAEELTPALSKHGMR